MSIKDQNDMAGNAGYGGYAMFANKVGRSLGHKAVQFGRDRDHGQTRQAVVVSPSQPLHHSQSGRNARNRRNRDHKRQEGGGSPEGTSC